MRGAEHGRVAGEETVEGHGALFHGVVELRHQVACQSACNGGGEGHAKGSGGTEVRGRGLVRRRKEKFRALRGGFLAVRVLCRWAW